MYGVLIADDEMIVRYGIKSMINWDKLQLTIVGDASNGVEAMEIFKLYNPEIVITDIKMPVMDGIELIKNIRKLNSETKIIILSCLQDFAYAKEAIRLGASEYFIKSDMMPADMEDILVKVKNSIVIEKTKLLQINEMRSRVLKNQVIEKEKFLWELSIDAVSNNKTSINIINQLELNYLRYGIFAINISIDYFDKIAVSMSEQKKAQLVAVVCDIAKKLLDNEGTYKGEVYAGNSGEINLIIKVLSSNSNSERNAFETVYSFGEKIIKQVKDETGYSVSIGISEPIDDLLNLNVAYSQARSACKFKVFFGCGRVISYQNTISKGTFDKKINLNFKELMDYVYAIKRNEVNRILESIFGRISELKDYEEVHTVSLELVLSLNSIYSEICKNDEEVFNKKKEYYEQIKYFETMDEIRNWFKQVFGQLMDSVADLYNTDRSIITKAVNYVSKNYAKDISLQTISNYVHLSKNYFGNMFKKEIGESFVEYLTRIRVENAKKLLRNSELKINDIGSMVGIEDSRYFSKVFKKGTGFTPKEYRDVKIFK